MDVLPFYQYLKRSKKPSSKHFNINPVTIGEHIRKRRIETGMLQSEVAAIIDTCEDTINGWENGRYQPVISFYPKIIDFLGYYPCEHPMHTAEGLIERARHSFGLSYEKLGTFIGVHGTTLITWRKNNFIPNPDSKEKLLLLLNSTQSLLS